MKNKKDNQTNYWKCEYENLRRKSNKRIDNLKLIIEKKTVLENAMLKKTFELLKTLGLSDDEIFSYYRRK